MYSKIASLRRRRSRRYTGLSVCLVLAKQPAQGAPMISDDAFEVLRTTSLFAGFTEEQLEVVPKVGRQRDFQPGELIVAEGAAGARSLWLVLEGEVEVRVGGEPHRTLGPGSHFGEMALLADAPRSADVVARAPTVALEFSRRHLEGLIAANPQLAIDMLRELARRLRGTTEILAEVIESSPQAAAAAHRLGLTKIDQEQPPHLGAIEYALQRVHVG